MKNINKASVLYVVSIAFFMAASVEFAFLVPALYAAVTLAVAVVCACVGVAIDDDVDYIKKINPEC